MDDHDQRFKTLLREFLPEFFALFFPDWAARFDFAGTEWLEQEAFLDPPGGEKRVLDVVGWDAYEERLWDHPLLRFEYAYIGLPALDGPTYFRGENSLGLALSALMKLPAADRARIKAEGLARIARSRENEVRKELLT